MENRIQYIDRLKGFAILLVVMGHIPLFCYHTGIENMDRFIGSFHMPLFMFLSGLVTKTKIAPEYDFIKWLKKIGGLLLPLFFFGICFTLYCTHTSNIDDVPYKVLSFVCSNNKMGYWYLFVLALFYASMPIYSLNKINCWYIDALIGIIIEIIFYIGWMPENKLTDVLCLLNVASFYPYFIMGYIFRKYNIIEFVKSNNIIFTISLLVYILLFCIPFETHILKIVSQRLLMPLSAILICLNLFMNREDNNSLVEQSLSSLGKKTLDIYIIHYFIICSINLTMLGKWYNYTNNYLLATINTVIVSIIIAYISVYIGKLLRRSKFINLYVFGEIFKQ